MCIYCFIADHQWKYDPLFSIPPTPVHVLPPTLAQTLNPGWDFVRLSEFYDLLKRVKDLEDQVGCICEPNKADYLGIIKNLLKLLEEKGK